MHAYHISDLMFTKHVSSHMPGVVNELIAHVRNVVLQIFGFFLCTLTFTTGQWTSTEQVLKTVAKQDCKVVALMGGERFFSRHVHSKNVISTVTKIF